MVGCSWLWLAVVACGWQWLAVCVLVIIFSPRGGAKEICFYYSSVGLLKNVLIPSSPLPLLFLICSENKKNAKKKKGGCTDDPSFDLDGLGGCDTYAPGEVNGLFCAVDDGACDACGCSCAHEAQCNIPAGIN